MSDHFEYIFDDRLYVSQKMWEKNYSPEEELAFIHLSNLKEKNLTADFIYKDLAIFLRISEKRAKKIVEKILSDSLFQEVRNDFIG